MRLQRALNVGAQLSARVRVFRQVLVVQLDNDAVAQRCELRNVGPRRVAHVRRYAGCRAARVEPLLTLQSRVRQVVDV